MKKSIVTIALALGASPALAQSTCPDFTAHEQYECRNYVKDQKTRTEESFRIGIKQGSVGGVTSIILTLSTGARTLVADGVPVTIETSTGKGTIAASCEGGKFVVRSRSVTPTDSTSIDKFSVESNKLIRMSYLVDGRVERFVRKTNCKPTRAQ